MTVDLTEEELWVIEGWYQTAAGESATLNSLIGYKESMERLVPILKKLGFSIDSHDLNAIKQYAPHLMVKK